MAPRSLPQGDAYDDSLIREPVEQIVLEDVAPPRPIEMGTVGSLSNLMLALHAFYNRLRGPDGKHIVKILTTDNQVTEIQKNFVELDKLMHPALPKQDSLDQVTSDALANRALDLCKKINAFIGRLLDPVDAGYALQLIQEAPPGWFDALTNLLLVQINRDLTPEIEERLVGLRKIQDELDKAAPHDALDAEIKKREMKESEESTSHDAQALGSPVAKKPKIGNDDDDDDDEGDPNELHIVEKP